MRMHPKLLFQPLRGLVASCCAGNRQLTRSAPPLPCRIDQSTSAYTGSRKLVWPSWHQKKHRLRLDWLEGPWRPHKRLWPHEAHAAGRMTWLQRARAREAAHAGSKHTCAPGDVDTSARCTQETRACRSASLGRGTCHAASLLAFTLKKQKRTIMSVPLYTWCCGQEQTSQPI